MLPFSYVNLPSPSLFYLQCTFYFLSLFTLFLFPTLIISPPFTLSQWFFFLLVISCSILLSYNSLNLFTPLLMFSHQVLIVWLWVAVSFAGVGLFPELCGFVLAAPAQLCTGHGEQCDSLSISGRKDSPNIDPPKPNTNYNQRFHINGIKRITRASSSGDQRDCTTEFHISPTTEGHTMKTASERSI